MEIKTEWKTNVLWCQISGKHPTHYQDKSSKFLNIFNATDNSINEFYLTCKYPNIILMSWWMTKNVLFLHMYIYHNKIKNGTRMWWSACWFFSGLEPKCLLWNFPSSLAASLAAWNDQGGRSRAVAPWTSGPLWNVLRSALFLQVKVLLDTQRLQTPRLLCNDTLKCRWMTSDGCNTVPRFYYLASAI